MRLFISPWKLHFLLRLRVIPGLFILTTFFPFVQAQPLYVVTGNSHDISVIDPATNQVTKTFAAGSGPSSITGSLDGSRLYIANSGSDCITVLNTATLDIVSILPCYAHPREIQISPDGRWLYVLNTDGRNILIYNTTTNQPVGMIAVKNNSKGMSISSDGKRIYLASGSSSVFPTDLASFIDIINISSRTIEASVPVDLDPSSTALSSDGGHLYVTHSNANLDPKLLNISVINTTTLQLEAKIPIGEATLGIAASADGAYLYATKPFQNQVIVISTSLNKIVASIPVDSYPSSVIFNSDDSNVYVSHPTTDKVSVISTATHKVISTVSAGSYPMAFWMPKEPAPATPNYQGFLDQVECGTIRGWVWDSKRPNTPLTVEFTADGQVIGTALANRFRQDLKDAGKGNGEHMYIFTTPNQLKDGKSHSISAKVQGTSYTLKWAPKSLICPAPGRLAADTTNSNSAWSAVVLGNPIERGVVEVELQGAQRQSVRLLLVDSKGQIVSQKQVTITERVERHRLPLNQKHSGLLLLQVSAPTYSKTIKVVSEK